MRIAILYDCLYPNTIGGAERWYRSLASRLAGRHDVTYVTRKQWGEAGPRTPFPTIAVSPGGGLYTTSGRRRIWPPLRFGFGVFIHMLRHGRSYDAVHAASFPYFSLLGAWLALRIVRSRARLVVDWHELWTGEYWKSYLGPIAGRIGFSVQSLCLRLPDRSFTFSRLVASRLDRSGHGAPVTQLSGEHEEDAERRQRLLEKGPSPSPSVVFAGRHIREKRVSAIPPAVAVARRELPELRCLLLGRGPETEAIREQVRALGLDSLVEVPGRVPPDEVAEALAAASCLLNPSAREGYGQILVEAFSVGTPAIVVAGPDNAATELIEPGVNGFIAGSADADELARAIVSAVRGGDELRRTTLSWYERHREELSIESSLATVEAVYMEGLV